MKKDIYLFLGEDTVILKNNIIGIFDIEKTSVSQITKDYLNFSDNSREIINVSFEMPKSFVVTYEKNIERIYITNISVATLKKRSVL